MLAAASFVAAPYDPDQTGPTGLPLTPCDVRIIGRYQDLKRLTHASLCTQIDMIRGRNERLFAVSEYHNDSVARWLHTRNSASIDEIRKIAFQILEALAFLNERDMVHRHLHPSNILLDEKGDVKLFNYGLHHISHHGVDLSFPIGDPRYLAPELIIFPELSATYNPKPDVWSLGLILLEIFLGKPLVRVMSPMSTAYKIRRDANVEMQPTVNFFKTMMTRFQNWQFANETNASAQRKKMENQGFPKMVPCVLHSKEVRELSGQRQSSTNTRKFGISNFNESDACGSSLSDETLRFPFIRVKQNDMTYEQVCLADILDLFYVRCSLKSNLDSSSIEPILDPLCNIDPNFSSFVIACLHVDFTSRPSASSLLSHPFFAPLINCTGLESRPRRSSADVTLSSNVLPMTARPLRVFPFSEWLAHPKLNDYSSNSSDSSKDSSSNDATSQLTWDPFSVLPMVHAWHIWKLAGGDLDHELQQQRLESMAISSSTASSFSETSFSNSSKTKSSPEAVFASSIPPILKLPLFVRAEDGMVFGGLRDAGALHEDIIVRINFEACRKRLLQSFPSAESKWMPLPPPSDLSTVLISMSESTLDRQQPLQLLQAASIPPSPSVSSKNSQELIPPQTDRGRRRSISLNLMISPLLAREHSPNSPTRSRSRSPYPPLLAKESNPELSRFSMYQERERDAGINDRNRRSSSQELDVEIGDMDFLSDYFQDTINQAWVNMANDAAYEVVNVDDYSSSPASNVNSRINEDPTKSTTTRYVNSLLGKNGTLAAATNNILVNHVSTAGALQDAVMGSILPSAHTNSSNVSSTSTKTAAAAASALLSSAKNLFQSSQLAVAHDFSRAVNLGRKLLATSASPSSPSSPSPPSSSSSSLSSSSIPTKTTTSPEAIVDAKVLSPTSPSTNLQSSALMSPFAVNEPVLSLSPVSNDAISTTTMQEEGQESDKGFKVSDMENSSKKEEQTLGVTLQELLNDSATIASTYAARSRLASLLPFVIRERDIDYQYQRIVVFNALLAEYPASRADIIREARNDIPPPLRGKIWAAILGVVGDTQAAYDQWDREAETATDRQIEVDIPRCHQYHPLLSSPTGHEKLRRLLKCWVAANHQLVYWQGLDSVSAPFLALNFNDEALAFASLQQFIPRFLNNFFLYDNSPVIQEYLAVFKHMISFHDPELASHLDNIGFNPELFSIPWFLTLFTHVFPLDKIYHLWDKILVGPPALPLFVGVSILRLLRDYLMRSEFNECIMIFSELPDLDMESCINSAMAMCRITPPSVHFREHSPENMEKKNNETADADLPWWELSVPVEVKKSELSPGISLEDLVTLGPLALVIDGRDEAEFQRAHYHMSVNISNVEASQQYLRQFPQRYNVVLADRGDSGPQLARRLVNCFFGRVAVLRGGADVLRSPKGGQLVSLCSCKPYREVVRRSKGDEPAVVVLKCNTPQVRQ